MTPTLLMWQLAILSVLSVSAMAATPATQPATRPTRNRHEPVTYFVDPAGDDSATGLAGHPFATIQKAASVAVARDTVQISAGVYHERVSLPHSGAYFGRTIRFEGAGPDKTIIDSHDLPGWSRGVFDTNGQDYLEISNIGVQNGNGAGFSIFSSWQVSLDNCRTFNTTDSGMKIDKSGMVKVTNSEMQQACWHGGEESLSIKRSQDVQIIGCTIHDTGHEGIDVKEGSKHVRIIGNHLHHVERQALYAEAWDSPTFDIRFENNRVHDCMFGIAAGSECGGLLSDIWFVNNLVYNNHGPGMIMADWGDNRFAHPVKDIHWIHNTVYNNGRPGGRGGGWGGGMVFENVNVTNAEVRNNILSQNILGQLYVTKDKLPPDAIVKDNLIDGISAQIGENTIGPVKFTDPDHGDFTVISNSTGVDAGARMSEVAKLK